jgi:hypothetical protein
VGTAPRVLEMERGGGGWGGMPPAMGQPPVAMLGGIIKGLSDAIDRFKWGTKDLFANAKKLGPLR